MSVRVLLSTMYPSHPPLENCLSCGAVIKKVCSLCRFGTILSKRVTLELCL